MVENRVIFRGWPRRNFVKMFDAGKLRMIGLPYSEKNIAEKFNVCAGCTNVTDDRQTTDTIAVPLAERTERRL